MLSLLLLILFVGILFKITGFVFRIIGVLLGCILGCFWAVYSGSFCGCFLRDLRRRYSVWV